MVVCLHLPSSPKHWLLDCAMPWFFLASGYWYSRSSKSFGENVRERVRSLLVPYYLWNILWFPILFSVHWIGLRYCGTDRAVDFSSTDSLSTAAPGLRSECCWAVSCGAFPMPGSLPQAHSCAGR